MKITFVLWGSLRTGGNVVIFEVINRMAAHGHDLTVVAMGPKYDGWFKFTSKVNFIFPEAEKFPTIKFRRKIATLSQIIQFFFRKYGRGLELSRALLLSRAIPEDSDYVVSTYFETAFSVQMCKNLKAEKIYYIQHFESVFFQDHFTKQRVKQTYYFPFRWIVNSSWLNSTLKKEIGRTGTVVLPSLDRDIFYPRTVKKDKNSFVVVSLGKGSEVKGLKYLFEALSMAKSSIPSIKLHLYGVEPALKDQSPVETVYEFAPSNDRLAEIYSAANAVVTPSLYESSPLPPLEAMACGAPAITTRYGTEDYCFDKVNSLVVNPEDAKGIHDALLEIYNNPELVRKMRESGFETANGISWERTAREFEEALLSKTSS